MFNRNKKMEMFFWQKQTFRNLENFINDAKSFTT